MPKLKTERDPWAGWKGMVLAQKEHLGMTDEQIAARLRQGKGSRGPSRQMVSRWRQNPDTMPLWAFARINRVLEIEAGAAREAVIVWR